MAKKGCITAVEPDALPEQAFYNDGWHPGEATMVFAPASRGEVDTPLGHAQLKP